MDSTFIKITIEGDELEIEGVYHPKDELEPEYFDVHFIEFTDPELYMSPLNPMGKCQMILTKLISEYMQKELISEYKRQAAEEELDNELDRRGE